MTTLLPFAGILAGCISLAAANPYLGRFQSIAQELDYSSGTGWQTTADAVGGFAAVLMGGWILQRSRVGSIEWAKLILYSAAAAPAAVLADLVSDSITRMAGSMSLLYSPGLETLSTFFLLIAAGRIPAAKFLGNVIGTVVLLLITVPIFRIFAEAIGSDDFYFQIEDWTRTLKTLQIGVPFLACSAVLQLQNWIERDAANTP